MVATDSHQLVLFKDVVEDKELNVTIDLSTYLPINMNYPETERLIPMEHTTQLVFHNLDEIKGLVDYLKASKKQLVDMDIKGSGFTLKLQDNPYMVYNQEVEWNGDELEISYNPSYLYNALAYLGRLVKEQPVEYTGDILISFNGDLRPFTVVFGSMTYLVTPVRNI
ncbi:DNA polymerase III beta chain [Lactobacillus phage LfeInf]|uniref:DNA polymerase III beta chain n=1 Tax=Lactobacillus phage LfeInf TaxID=1567484 RepID=A0A0A7NP70_9CAUD|nr:DNA polymerase [Lactobacillus phage LfeInf]AIZ94749.1 DNA polymerase III beta chain [Lactobacillus phage LfeInf]